MAPLTCVICDNDLCKPSDVGQIEENTDTDQNNDLPGSSRGTRVTRGGTTAVKGVKRPKATYLPNAIPTDISCAPCGHLFHTKCLQSWFASHPRKCPKCKSSMPATKIVKLFPTIDRNAEGRIPSPTGPVAKQSKISVIENISTFEPRLYQGDSYSELKEIHTSLMSDYDELQRNVSEQRDVLLIKEATLSSLQDVQNILKQELVELKLVQKIEEQDKKGVKKRTARLGP